jgi:SAM-dependent methyltransferase
MSFDASQGADPLRPSAEAALAAWGARVRANNAQVERYAEQAPRADHFAPLVRRFQVDPRRQGDVVLDALLALARPDETWLDVGAGAGRYALPLALRVREVVALDASPGMIDGLRAGMAEHGIANVQPRVGRWPVAEPPRADVALIVNVGYDIADIGPFLDALEQAATRQCVAVLAARRPTWATDTLWPAVHGEARAPLPALPEFLALQLARRRVCEVRFVEGPPQAYESFEAALEFARIQTWVTPGSPKDAQLQTVLRERLTERDGRWAFSWDPVPVGIVTWRPGQTIPPG